MYVCVFVLVLCVKVCANVCGKVCVSRLCQWFVLNSALGFVSVVCVKRLWEYLCEGLWQLFV